MHSRAEPILGNIREVDAILHVLRCFADINITYVEETDPVRDAEVVETELMLADLESLENGLSPLPKKLGRRGSRGELDQWSGFWY